MAALTFDLTAIDQERAREEIAAALSIPAPYVDVYEDRIEVVGMVDESMIAAIQAVLDAHDPIPPPAPASLEEQVAALTDALATLTADFLGGV